MQSFGDADKILLSVLDSHAWKFRKLVVSYCFYQCQYRHAVEAVVHPKIVDLVLSSSVLTKYKIEKSELIKNVKEEIIGDPSK